MEDELVKIWQSSPNTEVIKFEKSRLMVDVQSGLSRIEMAIKARDRHELMACLAIIPAFGITACFIPFLLSKIACILIVAWSIFVLIRLKQAKKNKPCSLSASYRDYLLQSKVFLQAQRQMLNTVLWWYILPFLVGCNLFLLGFVMNSGKIAVLLKAEVVFVIISVIIYYLNKHVVRTMLDPKLEQIDAVLQAIE